MDKKVSITKKYLSPNNAIVKLSIRRARENMNRKIKRNLILGKGVRTKTTFYSTVVSSTCPPSRLGEYLKRYVNNRFYWQLIVFWSKVNTDTGTCGSQQCEQSNTANCQPNNAFDCSFPTG